MGTPGTHAPTTVDEVANFFLRFANNHGDLLTNLKLQKLLYYAQAWHLALKGEPLVNEKFEAWVHGPVHPGTYRKYKRFKWHPIEVDINPEPDLPREVEEYLVEVYEAYGDFTAYQLERMTHEEEPWLEARGDLSPIEQSSATLSEALMKRYYAERAADG